MVVFDVCGITDVALGGSADTINFVGTSIFDKWTMTVVAVMNSLHNIRITKTMN